MKRIFIVVVSLLIVVILILLLALHQKKGTIEGYKDKEKIYTNSIKIWRDKEGKARAQSVAFAANAKTVEEVMSNQMETLKKEITGLKIKNLNSRTKVETILKDSLVIDLKDSTVIINDSTIRAYTFNFTDSLYTTIKGSIINNKLNIFYHSKAPLTVTIFRKRIKKRYFFDLFPPFETVVEGRSLNPKVEVTGIESNSNKA